MARYMNFEYEHINTAQNINSTSSHEHKISYNISRTSSLWYNLLKRLHKFRLEGKFLCEKYVNPKLKLILPLKL